MFPIQISHRSLSNLRKIRSDRVFHLNHFKALEGKITAYTRASARTYYSQWAKCSQAPVFINKVLLEHHHGHLFSYCLWLFLLRWQRCHRPPDLQSLKHLLSGPLQKKCAHAWLSCLFFYHCCKIYIKLPF